MSDPWSEGQQQQVQTLALCGFDFLASCYLVLKVCDAHSAREFLADGLREFGGVAFGPRDRRREGGGDDLREPAVSIGFTYRGLQALGVPDRYIGELRTRAPAFYQGAPARAARLGDCGPGAAEQWEDRFVLDRAHVLLAIHGPSKDVVEATLRHLAGAAGARLGLAGWDEPLCAEQLLDGDGNPTVHFGFRDNIARPRIVARQFDPPKLRHHAGELLLGYSNDEEFNRWDDGLTASDITTFFRNGSFAVLRKIEQDEAAFNKYLSDQARLHALSPDYIKAKLCGRWPNGARVLPGFPYPTGQDPKESFDFADDPDGFGCPFGAHIRRTNPRADPIAPPRLRPLFRRGMPYGPKYDPTRNGSKDEKRGLIGLFFCASIDDQFETVLSEWVEKKPMGTRNLGDARDPLVGHHDSESVFVIPQQRGPDIKLTSFKPFVTTRGTLYAFFPSRLALDQIARIARVDHSQGAQTGPDQQAGARRNQSSGQETCARTKRFEDAPNDRFCDIVMEGGVTSGIIYASAVVSLAKRYRFNSIGGSSIGAFAAALTAAAEYSRRRGSGAGFMLMDQLPDELAKENEKKETRLLRLFRPQKATRRLFNIFLAALNRTSKLSMLVCGLGAAIRQYWVAVLIAIVAAVSLVLSGAGRLLAGLGSPLLVLAIVLVAAVVFALVVGIIWDFCRGLVANGFGLCRGWSKDEQMGLADSLDLAGFLHGSIQQAAGRHPIDDDPLTFADLRDAPGPANEALGLPRRTEALPSIDLQVYSTNLAHGRPYRFPLDPEDDMGRLFFKADELKEYFPSAVLDYLVRVSRPYSAIPRNADEREPGDATKDLLELPTWRLPIVVAARLAMSFPLLISAVPLWGIVYEAPAATRRFARCWMSDGGLCSNFPIHLFDSFVPEWPTFGIALLNRTRDRPLQNVWLPDKHYQGRADTWNHFAEITGSFGRLTGFLVSLWLAAWRWNDSTMMRMPGVRDRVVRIFLESGEGGVNIKMPKSAIDALSRKYGLPAAHAFIAKFASSYCDGWPEHRWVRFNRLLIALRKQIEGFATAAGLDRYAPSLSTQIDTAQRAAPLRGRAGSTAPSEQPLSADQVRELRYLLAALARLESRFGAAGNYRPYEAVPRPSLRVRHPT